MKRILVITFSYYPSFHGGVPRIAAFCKYLQQFGWTPVLIAYDSRNDDNMGKTNNADTCTVIRISSQVSGGYSNNRLLRSLGILVRIPFVSVSEMSMRHFEKKIQQVADDICARGKFDLILAR